MFLCHLTIDNFFVLLSEGIVMSQYFLSGTQASLDMTLLSGNSMSGIFHSKPTWYLSPTYFTVSWRVWRALLSSRNLGDVCSYLVPNKSVLHQFYTCLCRRSSSEETVWTSSCRIASNMLVPSNIITSLESTSGISKSATWGQTCITEQLILYRFSC